MRFFVPGVVDAEAEAAYAQIKQALWAQFRLPILEQRISSLNYVNSKRSWRAEVGQEEQQERRYEIVAIFESKHFIIFTRTADGVAGPIILVDKAEVTAVEHFEAVAA